MCATCCSTKLELAYACSASGLLLWRWLLGLNVSQRLFTAWREEEIDNVCQCVHACMAVLSSMPNSYGWTQRLKPSLLTQGDSSLISIHSAIESNSYLTRAKVRCQIFLHTSFWDTGVRWGPFIYTRILFLWLAQGTYKRPIRWSSPNKEKKTYWVSLKLFVKPLW